MNIGSDDSIQEDEEDHSVVAIGAPPALPANKSIAMADSAMSENPIHTPELRNIARIASKVEKKITWSI